MVIIIKFMFLILKLLLQIYFLLMLYFQKYKIQIKKYIYRIFFKRRKEKEKKKKRRRRKKKKKDQHKKKNNMDQLAGCFLDYFRSQMATRPVDERRDGTTSG